jgi:FAD binding domain-containing protein
VRAAGALDAVDWPALARGMAGELILAGDPRMVLAGKHYAARLPFVPPRALLRCRSVDDVRRALDFVRERRPPFAVRSGGHCFGDLSSSPGLVIDLAEMNALAWQGRRVRVGPGLASGELSRALAARGRIVPTGGCPLVAIAGLALAGGFGFLGRRHGLVADRVVRLEALLADGRLVAASAEEEPDLFWALRGGGGGFGIVTGLTLATRKLEPLTAVNGRWPLAEAPALIDAWQHWAPSAPRAVGLELGLVAPDLDDRPAFVELFGPILGEPERAARPLAALRRLLGPLAAGLDTWDLPAAAAADFLVGLLNHRAAPAWLPKRPYAEVGCQATASQFFDRPVSRLALDALVARFAADRLYAQSRELELVPWGGAYARGSACSAHRRARLLVRHTAYTGARSDPGLRAHASAWTAAALAADASGRSYQGYAEPARPDWARACHAAAAPRLAALRARYDGDGLWGQSI